MDGLWRGRVGSGGLGSTKAKCIGLLFFPALEEARIAGASQAIDALSTSKLPAKPKFAGRKLLSAKDSEAGSAPMLSA